MNWRVRVLERVRQDEYIGENRCTPCTILNLLIAISVSGVIGAFTRVGAVLVFFIFIAIIYLRGYLLPGTPSLTKQYFPDRLLNLFHAPSSHDSIKNSDQTERRLILESADAIRLTPDESDISLALSFKREWNDQMNQLRDGDQYKHFIEELSLAENDVSLSNSGDVYVEVSDAKRVQWGSETALIADAAASSVLSDRYHKWENVPLETKHDLLKGLRVFLDECPACGGDTTFVRENIPTGCCSSMRVSVSKCTDCGSRLVEGNVSTEEGFL